MVMLLPFNTLKHDLLPVCHIISIVIIKIPDIWTLRDNNPVTKHCNTKRGIEFRTLIKNFCSV